MNFSKHHLDHIIISYVFETLVQCGWNDSVRMDP